MVNHRAVALVQRGAFVQSPPKKTNGLLRLAAFVAAVGVVAWSFSSSSPSSSNDEDDADDPPRPPRPPRAAAKQPVISEHSAPSQSDPEGDA